MNRRPQTADGLRKVALRVNDLQAVDPRALCTPELLEESLQLRPNATAVEFEGRSLTYRELHQRANQLAHLLRQKGVGPDVLVGICMERCLEMPVALLGVLKAGGGYVPLDPSYGNGRIQYVLDEARVKVLITQERLGDDLPPTSASFVCLDPGFQVLTDQSKEAPPPLADPSNLSYVIYTSGSTGKPKGVQLEHRSLVNFLRSMRIEPGMGPEDVLVAVTTLSFDIAGLEMFLPLVAGARVVIASRQTTHDGKLLMQLLKRSRATVLQATPATWRLLFESGWKGDRRLKVLVGGEALSPDLAQRLVSSCGQVWNMYGPTETTIWSSLYRVRGKEDRIVPIGKPIANTTLHVLDENRKPVGPGSEGELYIGGDGLARGYFQRPELTSEKFVPDPFSNAKDARMYRTGDLVRVGPDGNIEFLGRLDHQVKIRGFRIELGEIEAVLEQHPSIRHAVVAAREEASGDKSLVGYFVVDSGESLSSAAMRAHLREQLPDYMVPAAFVQLNEFPLTPNGKVDRKALPAPGPDDYQSGREYIAPRDGVERKLAALWEKTLGVKPVGARDNFFDLGGTSIRAARLFTDVLRTFKKELPLSSLLKAPTLELLANELRPAGQNERFPTLVSMGAGGSKTPFFVVHGGAGGTLFMRRLATRMQGRPFYGIEPDGMDGQRLRYRTLEEAAAHYLAEVRKVQPAGPYLLGGYCFGGKVAFEMAQQLLSRGDRAAAVVLITAPLNDNRRDLNDDDGLEEEPVHIHPPRRGWGVRLRRLVSSPSEVLSWRLTLLREAVQYPVILGLGMRVPPSLRRSYLGTVLRNMEDRYVPKPYPGKVTHLHGSNLTEFGPELGWEGLAGNFEHLVIGDGTYQSRRQLFIEPLVERTASELNALLDAAIGEGEDRGQPKAAKAQA